jgi:hypothetical protein
MTEDDEPVVDDEMPTAELVGCALKCLGIGIVAGISLIATMMLAAFYS